ncbi:hypothetical protein ACPCSE_29840 [Streptomyces cellulosae]
MTTPPWGHKPPAVSDPARYQFQRPPHQSLRCQYWLSRLNAGTWRPNRYLLRECADCAARQLGVWIWEYTQLIKPRFAELKEREASDAR